MRLCRGGLDNIYSSKAYPSVEWSVEVDKQKAAQLGVRVSDVGALVQMLTSGFKVGEYRPDEAKDEVEIRARIPDSDRTITGIRDLKVVTKQGTVPGSSFVQVVPKENRQTVNRKNGRDFQEIGAGTEEESKGSEKIDQLSKGLRASDLGPSISYEFGGRAEETEEVNRFIMLAGITAIFMKLLRLITQFNSFYQSFIILSAVTISLVGVLLGLLITGKSFSTKKKGISIVTLAGIVEKNKKVLIDKFKKTQRRVTSN
jgi:Cation/multidrug efflux pump